MTVSNDVLNSKLENISAAIQEYKDALEAFKTQHIILHETGAERAHAFELLFMERLIKLETAFLGTMAPKDLEARLSKVEGEIATHRTIASIILGGITVAIGVISTFLKNIIDAVNSGAKHP